MRQSELNGSAHSSPEGKIVARQPAHRPPDEDRVLIKLSDYIVERLEAWGAGQVFLVTGGGAMHLNDSLTHGSKLRYLCTHHEQAAAMAAEVYARVAGQPAILNVTTGPGGINALNGVFGAWTDSVPMLVLSGQVKRETCMASLGIQGLRQLGDQEVDILAMARGITKYSALVDDPLSIAYHLERAWHLARHGRPAPCWLDIPVDVQAARIDPAKLRHYDPEAEQEILHFDTRLLRRQASEVLERLRHAERPVILAGTGIRIGDAVGSFERLTRALRLPVATAWCHDLMASNDALFCGRPGTIGERAGNFAVQNADVLLVLGSRLNLRQVSFNWKSFARHAFKIQVDIDEAELHKPTVECEMPIHADLRPFLDELATLAEAQPLANPAHTGWLAQCQSWREQYPVVCAEQRREGPPLNPYGFTEALFAALAGNDVIVCANATATIVPFQAGSLQRGQRLISNSGAASMGHELPAAVGAAVARQGGRVICLGGDGSIQMNLQELQTIASHAMNVKIFVLNNGGYLSIRSTQANFFGRLAGEGPSDGISFPDMAKLATAYGIPSRHVHTMTEAREAFAALAEPGPALFEVHLDPQQGFEPRLRSRQLEDGTIVSPNLEDMYPFLSPEELAENMVSEKKR